MILRSFALPNDFPLHPRRNPTPTNPRMRDDLLARKRKRRRPLTRAGLDDLFPSLISAFPALDLVAPALGFASGAGASLYLSSRQKSANLKETAAAAAGDFILYASPTPFNRCVLLRCPSLLFEDGVSDRLLSEERHYVKLSRGGVLDGSSEYEISYQRVCVGTDDGGVISLDWPENLELDKELGFDTTVLIVPGTAGGSADRDVRMFVCDALEHGCFPVVMNPRGCAGSPLTTARLFTAADSDDICTAVQFVNKLRPWTTLMSIGWGYGANMLTKYLAEVGEATALTAAVCIDNPFDLEEATRSFPYCTAMDQKLTSGLVDILQANKELFQGKAKGFDVAKALSATSVRCFDEAISMISYGVDEIEDFYSKTSTRQSISSVKIPVLFIQSSDKAVPPFSVPRSLIAENPFTSLLLCSCLPSTIIRSERSAILGCQHIAIEWLSAVEFALLKGRHPLLMDVDITFNPSKGITFLDEGASKRKISANNKVSRSYGPASLFSSSKDLNGPALTKLTLSTSVKGFQFDPLVNVNESDSADQDRDSRQSITGSELHGMRVIDSGIKQEKDADTFQNDSGNTNDNVAKGGDSSMDTEGSHVIQTASVVMNMLDVTMPGTLNAEQQKKVLTAMEQGDTLMKALQGAVPEDVRGKLTTAVTEILQTQRTNVSFDGLNRIGWIPNMTSDVNSRIQEKNEGILTERSGHIDNQISDQGTVSEGRTEEDSNSLYSGNNSTQESTESSQAKFAETTGYMDGGSEEPCKPSQTNKLEIEGGDINDAPREQVKVNQSTDDVVVDDVNDVHINDGKIDERNMPLSSSKLEEAFSDSSSTSEHQVVEKEGTEVLKMEGKTGQDVADQNVQSSSTKPEETPKAPSISVTQALDAFTNFDDSTQMAVNSVFGVLENMIDKLEKANNEGNDEEINVKDQGSENASHDLPHNTGDKSGKMKDDSNRSGVDSDTQLSDLPENGVQEEHSEGTFEENKGMYGLTSSSNHFQGTDVNHFDSTNTDKVKHIPNFPLHIATNSDWGSIHDAYLQRHLSAQFPMIEPLNSDSTTELFLDLDEAQWKMINQLWIRKNLIGERGKNKISKKYRTVRSSLKESEVESIIEPSYVILDAEYSRLEHQKTGENASIYRSSKQEDAKKEELMCLVKKALLDALKVEVGRRLGMPSMEELESKIIYDLEQVADTVSQAVVCDNELNLDLFMESNDLGPLKFGTIDGEYLIKTISAAVQDASRLKRVLPVGVIVGSSLATLRQFFQVVTYEQSNAVHKPENIDKLSGQVGDIKAELCADEQDQYADSDNSVSELGVKLNNNDFMVGAVTAALGASALLAHHQRKKIYKLDETTEIPSGSSYEKGFPRVDHDKLGEAMHEKNHSNLVDSLAEKAMSVAGPVVPTKNDGELDQERLVTMLAELGQKGGILRLVGKFALLWGGVRGAISLTERLISFFHIAERPLFQRFLGFVFMVLVLWSPVVIPLLPTLVRNWTIKASNGVAEFACIIGLYFAITILVMLWGKRIRGYDNPLQQYGLDLMSPPRIHEFLKGLVGGIMIVLCIHSVNALLGYACLSWPLGLPSSSANAVTFLGAYGSMLLRTVRGIITATSIAVVEELLFRSWMVEEITVELGYHRAIMITGVAFSLVQRSLASVPSFLLLSLALFGIKQRAHGKLSAPVGIRAGIMTANCIMQSGFLSYRPGTPFWLSSTHPWHPFDGVVGLSFCLALAIVFYPRQPSEHKEISKG